MSDAGKRIIEGATEALAIAKGEKPAASIFHNGHQYVLLQPLTKSTLKTALMREREEGRLEGLEEAAKVADEYDFRSNTEEDVQAYRIATAIRALKEKQQ